MWQRRGTLCTAQAVWQAGAKVGIATLRKGRGFAEWPRCPCPEHTAPGLIAGTLACAPVELGPSHTVKYEAGQAF